MYNNIMYRMILVVSNKLMLTVSSGFRHTTYDGEPNLPDRGEKDIFRGRVGCWEGKMNAARKVVVFGKVVFDLIQ